MTDKQHFFVGDKVPQPMTINDYLRPGVFIDSDHPSVKAFAHSALKGAGIAPVERAVALYYAVRDGLRYDPYSMDMEGANFTASHIATQTSAFCIPKAILLTACARASGIPSRIGYADVRNHLCSPKLKAAMAGNDLFMYHGYVEMYLEGKWVKSTPAFNRELCEKVGIEALGFNGRDDSMMHPFDKAGRQHMEYVQDHGHFFDHPHERIQSTFKEAYGDLERVLSDVKGDFTAEVSVN
jgi:transglutaminase-like putative cysteine protease